ncbi:unnamed protein product [Paramecium sonneborni]|uniref:RING-type domain-containing protein n=1 Tax=Paramecium sonneborni TaxID=65129 RepID=A0A8S1RDM5_9CILI|nr:unnamed protein product [Paramecium sonneborni]
MGQQQTQQQRPLNVLIKDVTTFNLLTKSPTIRSSLGKQLLAEVIERKENLIDSLSFLKKQDILCIRIILDNQYFQITQERFYYSKQLLEDLSSILMSDPSKEDGICQICFEKKIDKLLPCGHSYCLNCIDGWFKLKEQNSCPMCRAQLTKQKIQNESFDVPNEAELIDSLKEQLFMQLCDQK